MKAKLRVLIVEDLPSDAELARRELKTVLENFSVKVVDTEEDFLHSLGTFKPDLIISDYKMPAFDGLSALQITGEKSPFTPFIILTGSMNEDTAVDCMKAGADDYVIKEHIKRLGPAVMNALENKRIEQERYKALHALQENEIKLRNIIENSSNLFYSHTTDHVLTYLSPQVIDILGYQPEEAMIKWTELASDNPINEEGFKLTVKAIETGKVQPPYELELVYKSGRKVWVEVREVPVVADGKTISIVGALIDITERKRAEAAIIESEKKYRHLVDNALVGVYRTNIKGDYLFANESFAKILQYDSLEEFLSLKAEQHYKNPVARKIFIEKVKSAGMVSNYELELITKKGNTRNVIVSATLEDDIISGMIMDITELKQTEKALVEAKEKAEKSDKLKSEFLAQMSHEVRTPLNTVLNFVDLIKDDVMDKVDEDILPSFDMIDSASRRMIRTIDLILNMSEIQAGSYEVIPITFDLYSNIIKSLYKEFNKSAKEKDLEFTVRKDTEETEITADEYSVKQIFVNLLDNAIKYTKEGSVEIKITKNKEGKLSVVVSDTGIGIAEEYLPDLFKPFTQEEQGYSRKFDGTGLGLSLVKKYCVLNNAQIEVESEKGKGTTFTIVFNNDVSD